MSEEEIKMEEKKQENKEEKQEEKQETKKIIVNSYYYYHDDMFSSPATILFIEFKNSTEQILVKRRILDNDMFYIPFYDGYIKLWQDRKGNILFYYSNYKRELYGIFGDKIDYYSDFHPCEGVELQINGPLKTFLEKYDYDEDLLNIIKSIICRKFNF